MRERGLGGGGGGEGRIEKERSKGDRKEERWENRDRGRREGWERENKVTYN